MLGSAGSVIDADIAQVWRAAAARSEALYQRRQGQSDLLLVRGVDAGYDDRQVLFGVDIDVKEGEIVALLGTNGAGKSTLLKAISGVVEADRGAVVLDGRDITHAPPNEIAELGISQMPGGQGVFGSLTVGENLRLAGWTRERRRRRCSARGSADDVPRAARAICGACGRSQRWTAADAGTRHGLHRQAAGVADRRAVARSRAGDRGSVAAARSPPRRRWSCGHPGRAERQRRARRWQSGRTSWSAARIRFSGPTADLLNRPDLLRSVFLTDIGASGTPAIARGCRQRANPRWKSSPIGRAFGGNRAVRRRVVRRRQGRDRRHDRAERRRQDHALRSHQWYIAADDGRAMLDGHDMTNDSRIGSGLVAGSVAASRTLGCSPT